MDEVIQKSVTAVPAYGRKYGDAAAVIADWNSGADFWLVAFGFGEAYGSKRDARRLLDAGFTHITFRNITGRVLTNIKLEA